MSESTEARRHGAGNRFMDVWVCGLMSLFMLCVSFIWGTLLVSAASASDTDHPAGRPYANDKSEVVVDTRNSILDTGEEQRAKGSSREPESQKAGEPESGTTGEPVVPLSGLPPGEDPHAFYLLVGERMFRSREFTRAREAFKKVLDLDSQDAQAHYFLGLIEYEEGNIEKAKTRFRIAHECLGRSPGTSQLPVDAGVPPALPDTKHTQLEFPEAYKARVYYKDGWYVRSKDTGAAHRSVYPLEAGSTYRIELESGRKESWARRGIIGLIVAMSFLLAR